MLAERFFGILSVDPVGAFFGIISVLIGVTSLNTPLAFTAKSLEYSLAAMRFAGEAPVWLHHLRMPLKPLLL